jgi:large subunit ribosomal protein L18
MATVNRREQARIKRKRRIRKNILGTAERPRLTVFRSARHIYAQVIDDTQGRTLAAASTLDKSIAADKEAKSKIDRATLVGKLIGQRAKENGVSKIVFDRNGFLYHGRIKAVSEGAREAGLNF